MTDVKHLITGAEACWESTRFSMIEMVAHDNEAKHDTRRNVVSHYACPTETIIFRLRRKAHQTLGVIFKAIFHVIGEKKLQQCGNAASEDVRCSVLWHVAVFGGLAKCAGVCPQWVKLLETWVWYIPSEQWNYSLSLLRCFTQVSFTMSYAGINKALWVLYIRFVLFWVLFFFCCCFVCCVPSSTFNKRIVDFCS